MLNHRVSRSFHGVTVCVADEFMRDSPCITSVQLCVTPWLIKKIIRERVPVSYIFFKILIIFLILSGSATFSSNSLNPGELPILTSSFLKIIRLAIIFRADK